MHRTRGAAVSLRGRERRAVWVVGLVAGLVAIGPGLLPGSLLNLDLVTTPEVPVPRGTWGLGPELPRRVPLYTVLAWFSGVVSGDLLQKVLMVLIVAVALAGVARRCEPLPVVVRLGIGAAYGLNPFLLTRLEVGHHTVALATALLPWALPVLLAPWRSGARLLRWSVLLALCGPHGAVLAGLLIGAALVTQRPRSRRPVVVATALLLGQLPWLVPGAIVWLQRGGGSPASDFPTFLGSPVDWPALLAGGGFWQQEQQLGWDAAWVGALWGAALVVLALLGWRQVEPAWRGSLLLAGVVAALVVVGGSVPGARGLWDAFAATPPGAALREGHRLLPVVLLPLLLAAAHGVDRVAHRLRATVGDLVRVAPSVAALAIALPGLWGLGGWLEPVPWPDEWQRARAAVREQPGTVVVLPWHLYLDVQWASGRRLLNPVPLYFGGDVLTSSDPELPGERHERGDPREPTATRLAEAVRRGRPVGDDLAALGVRWVVLMEEEPISEYVSIRSETGLVPVVTGPTLQLLQVRDWPGPAVAVDGRVLPVEARTAALAGFPAGGAATVHRAGGWGWRRGLLPAQTGATGLLVVESGSGPLWYPPAFLALGGYAATLSALVATRRMPRAARG